MKKINILKSNHDYNRIITSGSIKKYKDYILYIEKTDDEIYHFGFSVGKKIGKAVIRNKIKRQLKNIIDKKNYQKGFNCIIMVKKSILNRTYQEIEKNLIEGLIKESLIKEER